MRTKTFIQDYFYYTRTERNGALVLCLLSIALLATAFFFMQSTQQPKSPDFRAHFASFTDVEEKPNQLNATFDLFEFDPNNVTKAEMIQLGLSPKLAQTIENFRNKGGQFRRKEDLLKIYGMQEAEFYRLEPYIELGSAKIASWKNDYSSERKPAIYFTFDPNTASKEDFIKLGLPEKTATTVIKFREKGGTFREKEDFKKIYGLKSKDYEALAPYITIQHPTAVNNQKTATQITQTTNTKSPDLKNQNVPQFAIDINQATVEDWQSLRGIGPAYAKRIVNFREKLGGFCQVEQVKETFGLPDSTFQAIKPHLQPSPVFRKIAINTASVEALKAHPYIDARKAAAIVSYREQHGAFSAADDLRQMKALPTDWLEKIYPYLQFD